MSQGTHYIISQGCVKYKFDRLTDLINAFTVNRYLNPEERFHLVVVSRQQTLAGTIDKPLQTIFCWADVVRYWDNVHYE